MRARAVQELLRLAWLAMRTERLLASGPEPEMKCGDAMPLADAMVLILCLMQAAGSSHLTSRGNVSFGEMVCALDERCPGVVSVGWPSGAA